MHLVKGNMRYIKEKGRGHKLLALLVALWLSRSVWWSCFISAKTPITPTRCAVDCERRMDLGGHAGDIVGKKKSFTPFDQDTYGSV